MNIYWPNGKGFWDNGLTIHATTGRLWGIPRTFVDYVKEPPPDGALCILVGPSMVKHPEIAEQVDKLPWKLVIHGSDESHEYKRDGYKWMQYPTPDCQGDRNVLIGWAQDTRDLMPRLVAPKYRNLDWAFSGQVNHHKRREMASVLSGNGVLVANAGFAQGVPREEHLRLLSDARIAPCPGGTVHPDSFRFYEALEAGCLPITDNPDWWAWMGVPCRSLESWVDLPQVMAEYSNRTLLQKDANKILAWWIGYKRQYTLNLNDDLLLFSKESAPANNVTVLITTSYIQAHPSTHIIDEVIKGVRERLPDSEIILMIDGLKEGNAEDYEEYKRVLIWNCNWNWKDVLPLVFDSWTHQAGMVRKALEYVRTPYILFTEHDTPLTGDIPMSRLLNTLEQSDVNLIRFYHYNYVPDETRYMFGDVESRTVPVRKTFQYSSRPHLAKTEFYRMMFREYIKTDKEFIEEVMEPICRREGWSEWMKMWVYSPNDMLRSLHSDGRHAK